MSNFGVFNPMILWSLSNGVRGSYPYIKKNGDCLVESCLMDLYANNAAGKYRCQSCFSSGDLRCNICPKVRLKRSISPLLCGLYGVVVL